MKIKVEMDAARQWAKIVEGLYENAHIGLPENQTHSKSPDEIVHATASIFAIASAGVWMFDITELVTTNQ